MVDSIFTSLSRKCFDQRRKYQDLHMLMHSGMASLKEKMAATLGISGRTWTGLDSSSPPREYVEIASLKDFCKSSIPEIIDNDLTSNGEVPFAMVVTLEHGEHSYPKISFRLPVVIRVKNASVEYSTWNASECRAETVPWSSRDAIIDTLIQMLDSHLEFDPLVGPPQKTSIGFIQLGE